MTWVPVLWALREYADTLDGLSSSTPTSSSDARANGAPLPDLPPPFPRPDGRGLAVTTFPSRLDAVLFGGLSGEVWLRPGVEGVTCGSPGARGVGGDGGVATGE